MFLLLDIEVVDNESGDIGDYLQDDKDDVINLPGGPDDEIDLEFIADKLGLIPNDNCKFTSIMV